MIYKIVLKAFFAIIKKSGKKQFLRIICHYATKQTCKHAISFLENFNPKLLEPEAFSSVEILLLSRDKRENKKFEIRRKITQTFLQNKLHLFLQNILI